MKKTIIVFIVLLFSMNVSSAPVNGWDKTKWGMPVTEVKNLYADSGIKEADRNDQILVIESMKINGRNYSATFIFRSGKLSEVSLVMKEAMAEDYQEAVNLISKKYGKTANSDKMTTVWSFPKTVITCKYSDFLGKGMLIITFSSQGNPGM